MGENDTKHFTGTVFFEDASTFFEGSAGSGNIINEPDIFPAKRGRHVWGQCKGIFQVIDTFFFRICFHLWFGETGTEENVREEGDIKSRDEGPREFLC
jgi:hypothetical protein